MTARAEGQANVELVALLPVAAVVIAALLQVLAAGAAREQAGHAAGAGAVALLERRDARTAVRGALPGWSDRRMRLTVRRGAVTVRIRPLTLVPGLAPLLTVAATARAGGGG